MKAKILTLFNHKGGVSKTTTTYNIAWEIASFGKKVLLVDGDPQCNLSSLILGEKFYEYYEKNETKNQNIKDAVRVAFEGRPSPIQSIECYSSSRNGNLYLVPGHMDLSAYDSSLSMALTSTNTLTTLQNLPGSFYELIRLCSEKYDIDYVFIDMNPGLSSINQTFFMMVDGFIIPTNPDPFSTMALKTLQTILPRWKNWLKSSIEIFQDSAYPLPNAGMKFIGAIIQRFNLRKQAAAKPYTAKIDQIKKSIKENLIPVFQKEDMIFDDPVLKEREYCLAEISEFGALLQKANQIGVPIFALTDSEIQESGTVLEQMKTNRNRFKQIFSDLANEIIKVL